MRPMLCSFALGVALSATTASFGGILPGGGGPGGPGGPITSGYGLEAGARTAFGFRGSESESDFDGGEFATSATAEENTYGTARASAMYAPADTYLPELKAFAQANAGANLDATATASGIQGYTYEGDAPTTLVINYTLDATLTPNAASSDTTASVNGDVAAWLGTNTFFSTDPGTLYFEILFGDPTLVRDEIFFNAAGLNEEIGSIALNVSPGDNFYVFARINARTSDLGIADAESTFTASFTDPTGVVPIAVPEPASAALLTLGGIAVMTRRRRA